MSSEDPIRPEADEDYWQREPRPEYLDPFHPLYGLNFCKPGPDALTLARQQYAEKQARIQAIKDERKQVLRR